MNNDEQKGYDFTKGCVKYLCNMIVFIAIFIFAALIFMNTFNIRTDDSDKNGWNRSGLKLHTDYKTGIQYFSTRNGGLIRREMINGY